MTDKHGQTSSNFMAFPFKSGGIKFPTWTKSGWQQVPETAGEPRRCEARAALFNSILVRSSLGVEACYVWVVSCCINVLQCFAWPAVAETSIYAKFSKILEMKEWKWWQVAGFVQKGSSPATTIQIALKLPLVWNVFLWQLIGWFSRLLSWRYL